MKVLANTLRERPLSALFMMGGAGPGTGIDTVWDGSLLGNAADGSIWFFLGPETASREARRAPANGPSRNPREGSRK